MSDAFDQVEKMFADIELFIHMYPKDKNIEKASVDLLASTLFAAENVIAFFTKGTCMAQKSFPWCQDIFSDGMIPREEVRYCCDSTRELRTKDD